MREEAMGHWLLGSGLLCAVLLVLALGVVAPVSSVLSGICELLAVASGMVFVGLLEGE